MITLDREFGSDDFKRAQNCSAHNNHDEVQSESQRGETFWEVCARAVTREEEMAKGSKTQNTICNGDKLGGKKAWSKVK